MQELGRHFIFELYGCSAKALDDLEGIKEAMLKGAVEAGATVVGEVFHRFSPQGVTGVVIIAESHFSVHTWPEYCYAAMDLFTCSSATEPGKAFSRIEGFLKPKSSTAMEVKRGMFTEGRA